MEDKTHNYITLTILECLLLFPGILSAKRVITQNKKGFEKSYHNFFYLCIFVSTWGLFVTVLFYMNDLKLLEKLSIKILFQVFLGILFYGVYTLIAIQANLYYNCTCKDQKIATSKTKKIFRFITSLVICIALFQIPNFFKLKRTNKLILNLTVYSISILPLLINFYFYFKIRSAIKDVSDTRMMKQIRKLFWIILVCFLIQLIGFVLLVITRFYPEKIDDLWSMIFEICYYTFMTFPPFVIMLILFKPTKHQSSHLLSSESSSDIDLIHV